MAAHDPAAEAERLRRRDDLLAWSVVELLRRLRDHSRGREPSNGQWWPES